MIIAGETNPGYHNTHAGGLAAIMQVENSPLGLLQAVISSHPLTLNSRVQVSSIPTTRSRRMAVTSNLWQCRSRACLQVLLQELSAKA